MALREGCIKFSWVALQQQSLRCISEIVFIIQSFSPWFVLGQNSHYHKYKGLDQGKKVMSDKDENNETTETTEAVEVSNSKENTDLNIKDKSKSDR